MNGRGAGYGESVRLMRELHRLIERDLGDSAEADAVRDQLDPYWPEMTGEEREVLGLLSAALYTLWDRPTATKPASAEAQARFRALLAERRWRELLSLLHEEPALATTADAAWLRAKGWLALGEPQIADEFLDLLRRLAPPARSLPRRPSNRRCAAPNPFPRMLTPEARP